MSPNLRRSAVVALFAAWPHISAADPAALIVGNEDYDAIENVPRADEVQELNTILAAQSFNLRTLRNASANDLRLALPELERDAGAREGAVVYLAGRFVHSATETYFLASNAALESLDAMRRVGVPMSTITALLSVSSGKAVLALGDGGVFEEDLAFLEPGVGEIAAPQGVTVLTGPPEDVRSALSALLEGEAVLDPEALLATGVTLSGFVPWNGRLPFGEIPLTAEAPDPRDAEIAFWDAVRRIDSVEAYETYLDRYPRGIYATEADERIAGLRDAPRREAEAVEAALGLSRTQRREIQRALTLLDYDPRGIDGIFGPGTRAAISSFQDREGFEVSGYLTREQIRELDRLARARADELEEEARIEAERAAREDRQYWRETGASGREEDLRRYLERFPNGIFAEEARAELRAIEEIRRPSVSAVEQLTWQRAEQNGSADAYREYLRRYPDGAYADAARQEIARLEEEARRGNDRRDAARGEEAMNLSVATRRTIEQRLDALDYRPGPVDGNFDDQTRDALLRYQQDRRLPATGYMNDATMVRILADTVISIFD